MTQRAYEWDPHPPTKRERIICGIWLLAFVAAMTNYYAGWQLFQGYDKLVWGGLLVAGLFLLARLPGVKRVEGVRRPLTYWVIIVVGLAIAFVLWLLRPGNL